MSEPRQYGSVLVEILRANEGRDPKRVRVKLKRLAESAFSFFRGTSALFAREWDAFRPPEPGPAFLICGDLHLENFGAYRGDEDEFLFDINDFDEAAIAPCAIDPVRCATSIMLAAEQWRLTPLQANGMVLAYLDEYRAAITTPVRSRAIDAAAPRLSRGPIGEILGKAALGNQADLLDRHTERLKNGTRRIKRDGDKHPDVPHDRASEVAVAFEEYGKSRGLPDVYRPLDVTGRVVGIGSLGVERYLVLIAGGGSSETNRLLDVKAEPPSVWIGFGGRLPDPPPKSEAARVVAAQRTLQARPTTGLDVVTIGGVDFRLREMIPEENRSSLDRFQEKPAKLCKAIVTAGRLTGLAHLRGVDAAGSPETTQALAEWARGPALDSVLAASARFAERTRRAFKQFRAERKVPDALPEALRKPFR